MILIEHNKGTQPVYLTLSPTQGGVNYLFKFLSKASGEETLFCQEDISLNTNFQKFEFNEGGEEPLNGGFILDTGSYNYTVYEIPYPTLDKAQIISTLGTGIVKIIAPNSLEYNSSINDDFKIYEG